MRTRQKLYLPFKRLIGIIGSLIGIIFCLVLFWWWAIPINCVATKGHPFFFHKRYGKHKKVFRMLKLRSMRVDADPNLAPSDMDEVKQASMETKFGSFLRKASIDETPQLFNILFGQMAFIGPRPGAAQNEEGLVVEREKYTPSAFEVKPGISGYAQVELKREHDPSQKAKLDSEYVQKMSFWFDISIFLKTLFHIGGSNKGK